MSEDLLSKLKVGINTLTIQTVYREFDAVYEERIRDSGTGYAIGIAKRIGGKYKISDHKRKICVAKDGIGFINTSQYWDVTGNNYAGAYSDQFVLVQISTNMGSSFVEFVANNDQAQEIVTWFESGK